MEKIDVQKCIVATVKANEDLLTAIETICSKHKIFNASIWSGIGSTVGGIFEDGKVVEEIPTELIVTNGKITKKADRYNVEFETALIDANGIIHFGKLKKNDNPVLILFELIIVEE
jgi:predicted DNA-binding protein with PD1-like motif